ncbi:hypothetical protein TNCV_3583201 [Trichonephila clavipes]|nr:hypothetical protein TNCV_3583201 [Trichonephila clavipes]
MLFEAYQAGLGSRSPISFGLLQGEWTNGLDLALLISDMRNSNKRLIVQLHNTRWLKGSVPASLLERNNYQESEVSDPKKSPPPQRFIASKLGMSSGTQSILEPIFEEEIPTLYGKGIDKAVFHMDKAFSHTSKLTAAYLAKKKKKNVN